MGKENIEEKVIGGSMTKFLKYSKYLLKHKLYVFLEMTKFGFKFWIPGLLHDISKFHLDEFIPYMNHFGNKAGIKEGRDKTGYYKPTNTGDSAFDYAWFLHQKRNPHHWQFWTQPDEGDKSIPFDIPNKHIIEMVCDWRGAGKAQGTPDTVSWYRKNGKKMSLTKKTRDRIEFYLGL